MNVAMIVSLLTHEDYTVVCKQDQSPLAEFRIQSMHSKSSPGSLNGSQLNGHISVILKPLIMLGGVTATNHAFANNF